MTRLSNVSSLKEVLIPGATTVNAGQMYVHADLNSVVVPTVTQTASAFATSIGASGIRTVDLGARLFDVDSAGTGKSIFET
jgi:hypothetical protein